MRTVVVLPDAPVATLDDYVAGGGGEGLIRARQLGPALTVKEITLARLRGRGGAGFPTGRKWDAVRDAGGRHHYAVCNAAEGEPATFKDRAILRTDPYQVVEGLAIAALAVGATEAFIAIKAGFRPERDRVETAVREMTGAGLLDGVSVGIAAGPDDYLFGEEKALLEVIEGNDPLPRILPPFQHGLFATAPQLGWEAHVTERGHTGEHEANPTLVNNVETLANVAQILRKGAEWFRTLGTAGSPGTLVATVVGDVARPGVVEVEMGTPLAEVIDRAGGSVDGRPFKAAFSGVANPVLPAAKFGTALTYEAMTAAGSGLGAAGFAVYDDRTCMVEVATAYSRFLATESCGQCPPCKIGSETITHHLERICWGEATDEDVDRISRFLRTVTDANRCYLGTQEQVVVSSILRAYADEFADHLGGVCRFEHRKLAVPRIDDLPL